MPAMRSDDRAHEPGRRRVVPPTAGRSLWLAAVWTGAGAAFVAAVVSIVLMTLCWLPSAGDAGNANSAVRAGLLAFLTALHGGLTLDGVGTSFVPLGMTLGVGTIAWRAGAGLADAADRLGETDRGRLLRAGALQTGTFVVACAAVAALAPLGTSSVSVARAAVSAALLFGVTGGVALAVNRPRTDTTPDSVGEPRLPPWLGPAARAGAAAAAVYLAAGALLAGGALVAHHDQVELLSRRVGGGVSGLPILLLGVLAAPNAAIAGASYLAGPGFAVGSGTSVALTSTPHGTVPAFPILGAVPSGQAAWFVWLLAVLTPLVAAAEAAEFVRRAPAADRWRIVAAGAALAGTFGAASSWLGGGAIGTGRLAAVGASPWRLGLAVAGGTGVALAAIVAVRLVIEVVRRAKQPDLAALDDLRGTFSVVRTSPDEVAAEPPAEEFADSDARSADGLAG